MTQHRLDELLSLGYTKEELRTLLDNNERLTIDAAIETYLRNLTPRTRDTYRTHLRRLQTGVAPICDQQCEPCCAPCGAGPVNDVNADVS